MSRDPRRRREADARRARREFVTVPDEPQPASEPGPPVWDNIIALYRKLLTAPLRPNDPRAWQFVREPVDVAAVVQAEEALEAYRLHLAQALPLSDPDPHYTRPPERLTWSPAAYAALRGLSGTAADMFTEIAGAIQKARGDVPW